jgi:hypothetical protein
MTLITIILGIRIESQYEDFLIYPLVIMNVITLSVVMLNVYMLSVVAPCKLYSTTIATLLLSKLTATASRIKKASPTTNTHS